MRTAAMRKTAMWMRGTALALVVGLLGSAAPALQADDAPGAPPRGAQPQPLEQALSALRLRMEAKLKEAELLEKQGKLDEALAATRDVERLYREGLDELQRLLPPRAPAPPAPTSPPLVRIVPPQPAFAAPRAVQPAANPAQTPAEAVANGLAWLAAHQSPDGGWRAADFGAWCNGQANPGEQPGGPGKPMYDTGVTGLALCAFLGAGYTNRGEHAFTKVVRNGLAYLRNVQDAEGCFGPRTTQHYVYNHAMASLAMVEAYGMAESPIFKGSAQKALDFIALARNPYFVWRYGVKPGDNDTSVTGWMALSLQSARLVNQAAAARGQPAPLVLDQEAFEGIRAWLDKMTDPDYGRVGYIQRGSGVARPQELVDRFPAEKSEAMTAVGLLLRTFLGEDPRSSDLFQKGAALLERLPPVWNPDDGSIDMVYWYFGTLSMFQAGGSRWIAWSRALKRASAGTQRQDGSHCSFKGSWDPLDPWGPDGGRVFSTALMTLCNEVAARFEKAAGGGAGDGSPR